MISRLPIVVRSTEVDMLGHVNNAVYQQWFEWGRFEWVREAGFTGDTLGRLGLALVVVHVSLDYRREARRDDQLVIETALCRLGRSSMTFRQRVMHADGGVAAEGHVVLATFDVRARAAGRLPEEARAAAAPLVTDALGQPGDRSARSA